MWALLKNPPSAPRLFMRAHLQLDFRGALLSEIRSKCRRAATGVPAEIPVHFWKTAKKKLDFLKQDKLLSCLGMYLALV